VKKEGFVFVVAGSEKADEYGCPIYDSGTRTIHLCSPGNKWFTLPHLSVLHEWGHATDKQLEHRGPFAPAGQIIREEARAWRFAVRAIRRNRALTTAERKQIRQSFRTYLIGYGKVKPNSAWGE
jgi:hypothetical protein